MSRVKTALCVLVLLASTAWTACSPTDQSSTDVSALPPDTPTLRVCEAANQPVGSRVRLLGNFDGFGYGTESKLVTLESDELCNDRGGGVIFATLQDGSQRDKLMDTRPGTQVIVEGTIDRVEEGRFVYLKNVIVKGNP